MRWLSSFALLLYFCILCTPQAFAVHDARLSPLADKQFYAVTAETLCNAETAETDSHDEPQLTATFCSSITSKDSALLNALTVSLIVRLISTVNARAPPFITSHSFFAGSNTASS